MFANDYVLRLAERYATARGLRLSTVSLYATGQGMLLHRLRNGHDITTRRAARVLQWFSDHWPSDLPWPSEIPRPEPSSGSSGSLKSVTQAPKDRDSAPAESVTQAPRYRSAGEALAMVEGALERKAAARADWDDIDWDAAWAAEGEALAAGMALGRDGRIASPRALCRALGVERHVYDGVIRMYADGRPGAGRQPRALRGGLSSAGRVFEVLVASGDRRFESRRLGAELMSAAMGGER